LRRCTISDSRYNGGSSRAGNTDPAPEVLMPRISRSLMLVGTLALVSVACGKGGDGTGKPLSGGDLPANSTDRPTANGWDPFAPATDPIPGGGDYPGCSGEQTATASQILGLIVAPICELAIKCGSSGQQPNDNNPPNGTQGVDTAGTCAAILNVDSMSAEIKDKGIAGVCMIFEEIEKRLIAHPECDPPLRVPEGVCLDAIQTCMTDLVAMGCSSGSSDGPKSCAGLNFGTSQGQGGSGGSGQGGSGQGGYAGDSDSGLGGAAGEAGSSQGGASGEAGSAGQAGAAGEAGSGQGGASGEAGSAGQAGSAPGDSGLDGSDATDSGLVDASLEAGG
jgi:hypothetical protein